MRSQRQTVANCVLSRCYSNHLRYSATLMPNSVSNSINDPRPIIKGQNIYPHLEVSSPRHQTSVMVEKVVLLSPKWSEKSVMNDQTCVTIDRTERTEMIVHGCPSDLLRDFQNMFWCNDNVKQLNVVIIAQKTNNDMSLWTEDVAKERVQVYETLITKAKNICETLNMQEQWTDFIDPSSGRPFFSPFKLASLRETDDRYSRFGYTIIDQGCCPVLCHSMWGTKVMICSVFTNAPFDVIVQSLQNLPSRQSEGKINL